MGWADGALPEARPRHLTLDAEGTAYAFEGLSGARDPGPHLPDAVLNRLNDILRGRLAQFRLPVIESHHAHVPIELNGGVIGAFAAWTPSHRTLDGTHGTVMRILASQTAVALQNCRCSASRGNCSGSRNAPTPRRAGTPPIWPPATPNCLPHNANSMRRSGISCWTPNAIGSPANCTTASPNVCCR